jgi:hypothetical protein
MKPLPTFSALAALLIASVPASAQQPDPLREAVGQVAVAYWQPLLDSYKSAIDRIVSPEDLATLDRLRVRWSIMIAEQAEAREARKKEAGADGGSGDVDMKVDPMRSAEILATMEQAQEIARRYPAGMSEIGRTVINDFQTFVSRLPGETDRLLAEKRIDIGQGAAAEGRRTLDRMAATVGSEPGAAGLRVAYELAFEPIVLLYNGSDLRQMISQTAGATGIDGSLLPESSLLSQNHPNPASSTTTIDYTLREGTSATSIRIYNAAGTLVMTLDEGARQAGTHSRMIDVSQLPSGSYLYQLVLLTARGEQVSAKMMRVVR